MTENNVNERELNKTQSVSDEEKRLKQIDLKKYIESKDLMQNEKQVNKNTAISLEQLFEQLDTDVVKFNFNHSKVRDTEYGRSAILTNTKKSLSLFISLDKSVLGSQLEKSGYVHFITLDSSGFIKVSKVNSENGKVYYVLNDIELKTNIKNKDSDAVEI